MALLTIDQSPTIADQILFNILAPDANGCFLSDEVPYKVDRVVIYYIERDFAGPNSAQYNQNIQDPTLLAQLQAAQEAACISATQANLDAVIAIQNQINATETTNTFYFKQAVPVAIFGTDDNPAWLSSDTGNAILTLVSPDSFGTPPLYGHFQLVWNPLGMREGDYFICWKWTPNPAGSSLAANVFFSLLGATQITTSIPTHQTDPTKYTTLQDRYLPSMFKMFLSNEDLSPMVIEEFNAAVAKGFTFLEDQANQIVDLIDANAVSEGLLIYLSNLFNLRLKSGDPTLWRRQIKTAIPYFKQKGTLIGLQNALASAGMTLSSLTKLWQIVSIYTFQELFDVTNSLQFTLKKVILLPVDVSNFELYYRDADSSTWTQLNSNYVTFQNMGGVSTMTWVGGSLSVNPVSLFEGDSIRVVYEVVDVPAPAQAVETYIRSLPLLDQRDERLQVCPLKNWNVRVIAEDDPLFSVVIPTRYPFIDPVVFGKIRTEFPYSENIYNMDEYNGSLRDSTLPCDIDQNFIDSCSNCQGSSYNVAIDISDLTNDRVLEAQDILQEFMPFHAVIQSLTFSGSIDEFIHPEEEIFTIIQMYGQETCLGGEGETIFNRTMMPVNELRRNILANASTIATDIGLGYNQTIVLFCPSTRLAELGINTNANLLEVLAPSVNAGTYTVTVTNGNTATVSGIINQPVNSSQFTFRISNQVYATSSATITQSNENSFTDGNVDFAGLGAKSIWDSQHSPNFSGGVWSITAAALGGNYQIANIFPNGVITLHDPFNTLPSVNASNITYTLYDNNMVSKATSTSGNFVIELRGEVNLGSINGVADARTIIKVGDYVLYNGTQYEINEFAEGMAYIFYIDAYNHGTVVGATINIYNRLLDNTVGEFDYCGLSLQTLTNYEVTLGIVDGANHPPVVTDNDLFKECFLILIGTNYYAISQINGFTITLDGPFQQWKTLGVGGTEVQFSILHFIKQPIDIAPTTQPDVPGHDFRYIDRRGNEVIDYTITTMMPMMWQLAALNAPKNDNGVTDFQIQKEGISYTIEYTDGNRQDGDIC